MKYCNILENIWSLSPLSFLLGFAPDVCAVTQCAASKSFQVVTRSFLINIFGFLCDLPDMDAGNLSKNILSSMLPSLHWLWFFFTEIQNVSQIMNNKRNMIFQPYNMVFVFNYGRSQPVLFCRPEWIWSCGDSSSNDDNVCSSFEDRTTRAYIPLIPTCSKHNDWDKVSMKIKYHPRKMKDAPQESAGADLRPGKKMEIGKIF